MTETHSEANNDDLFGESQGETTSTATLEEVPGTEASDEAEEVAGETEVSEETEEVQSQDETPEEAQVENADVLRIIAKKGIALDKFNEYLTRYKLTAEQVNANPSLAHLVLDKAAADDLIAKQTKVEEKPQEEAKQDPPVDLDAHFKSLAEQANSFTDPKVLDHLAAKFGGSAEDISATRQHLEILNLAAMNLFNTMQRKNDEGFGERLERYIAERSRREQEAITAHEGAWEPYAELNPDFKDGIAALQEAAKREPELVNNPNLTPQQRMKTVALVLGGRKVEAQKVTEAAEKGKKQGLEATNKGKLGKALGAGKSSGAMTQKPKGNDDIFGPAEDSSRLAGFNRG